MKKLLLAMLVVAFFYRFDGKIIGPFRTLEMCEADRIALFKAMDTYGRNVAERAVSPKCWEAYQ